MTTKRSQHLRNLSQLGITALIGMCLLTVQPRPAEAVLTLLGGQLFYAGGDVRIDVRQNETVYTEELRLFSVDPDYSIAYNYEVGKVVTLTEAQLAAWGIGVGDELTFGIHVLNTGYDYVTGPAGRNPDGVLHANVIAVGGGVYDVGFEDLYGGGDRDYNDTVFRFTGVSVAEPASALLLLPGLGLLAWSVRGSKRDSVRES